MNAIYQPNLLHEFSKFNAIKFPAKLDIKNDDNKNKNENNENKKMKIKK